METVQVKPCVYRITNVVTGRSYAQVATPRPQVPLIMPTADSDAWDDLE